jgi:hypothetical protein
MIVAPRQARNFPHLIIAHLRERSQVPLAWLSSRSLTFVERGPMSDVD